MEIVSCRGDWCGGFANFTFSPFHLFDFYENTTISHFHIFTFLRKHHDFTISRFHFWRKHHDFTISLFHDFTASISRNDAISFNLAPTPSREPWAYYCPQSRRDAIVRPDGAARGETKLAWAIPSRDRGRQSQTPPENDGTKWLSGKVGYNERGCG